MITLLIYISFSIGIIFYWCTLYYCNIVKECCRVLQGNLAVLEIGLFVNNNKKCE